MPFDGNGNWSSNFSAEADRDAGYKILASRFDNIFIADIAAGFGYCVTRDGQGIMQTNTNANNYRVINVATPIDDKDSTNKKYVDDGIDALDQQTTQALDGKMDKDLSNATQDANDLIANACLPDYASAISAPVGSYTCTENTFVLWLYSNMQWLEVKVDGERLFYSGTYGSDSASVEFVFPKGAELTYNITPTLMCPLTGI